MKSSIRQLVVFLGIGVMAIVFGLGIGINSVQAETATGTIESQIFSTGGLVDFGTISWLAATTSTSTITIKVRTDSNSNMSGATAWESCDTVVNGADISANNCVTDGERYVQYLATFTTEYTSVSEFSSAQLQEVTINYNKMGTLISSPFNTLVTDNAVTKIEWNESITGDANVLFQMRTAPNSGGSPGTWSDWLGTSSASDYYTDPGGGETINSVHSSGSNDQWIQYKVFLISDGTNLPVLSDITITYDADIPIVTGATPNSATIGTSSMAVTISGSDFADNPTVQFINGSQTIDATNVSVVSPTTITCTVDLANEPAGYYDIKVTNANTGTHTLTNAYQVQYSTGTFISSIKDMGGPMTFGPISWTASTSASSTITMKVRTDTNADMSGAPDWATCDNITSGSDISLNNCATDGHQYIQYQATYQSEYDGSADFATPELYSVSLGYDSLQTLISSSYDMIVTDAVIQSISWSENLAGNSDATFQLRTSSDNNNWTSWQGPTGTDDYYTDSTGGETVNAAYRDGANDRYVQYKVYLLADGANLPVVEDVTINYTSNIPIISSISPTSTTTAPSAIDITISGSDFVAGATVVFTNDLGQSVTAVNPTINSNEITCNDLNFSNESGGRWSVTVTNTNTGTDTLADAFLIEQNTGTITSEIKDLGNGVEFGEITWAGATTSTSTITIKVRSDSNSNMSGATAWASCSDVAYGSDITGNNCITDGHQYLQYQATLTTNYATSSAYATPELGEVKVVYYTYASSSLISNYFDTAEIHNVINSFVWNEDVPASSDVCVQVRTSPGEAGAPTSWSDWIGATGVDTCYTSPTGSSIYSTQRDGYNDRWLQYKVTLVPDGINVPTLSDLEIVYVTAASTPTVVTSPIAWTGSTVAKGIGRISDDGSGPISTVGFQYGLTQEPTWSVSKDVYFNNDAFDLVMNDLDKDTKYYFRAFAVNARGTSTGEWEEFTSKATTTLQTVILKTRTILKSNLMLR